MKQHTEKLYHWAMQKATSKRAPFWIGVLFFLELFLFIPLDAVLMFFCSQEQKRSFLYVAIAAITSTISGCLGYLFGHFLWDLVGSFFVPHLISAASFERTAAHLQLYENWAVFFGTLLPFPLKVLSLSAGVFHLGLPSFTLYLLLARLLRFSLIGTAMIFWGDKVKSFVDRHFHRIFLVLGAKIAMVALFFWFLGR